MVDRINICKLEDEFEKETTDNINLIYKAARKQILQQIRKIIRLKENPATNSMAIGVIGSSDVPFTICDDDYYVLIRVPSVDKYDLKVIEKLEEMLKDDGFITFNYFSVGCKKAEKTIHVDFKNIQSIWNYRIDGPEYNKNIIG